MLTTKALLLISHGLKNISYFVCFVGWFFCFVFFFCLITRLFVFRAKGGLREASAMCESGTRGGAFYRPHALAHDSLFALALRFPLLALKTNKKLSP